MSEPNYVSLEDFASTFGDGNDAIPAWVHPHARTPAVLERIGLRYRLEDVLDTIVALQRADRLQAGIYASPSAMSHVYRSVLTASRTLHVAVPPAILAGTGLRMQGCFGTDGRAFLYLSTYFYDPADEGERDFMSGRFCGYIAARLVTANTMYALIADNGGIRTLVPRGLRPVLDVVLSPLSLGVKIALSRWQRACEVSVDRAGLVVCRDIDMAARALMRQTLGRKPQIDRETYLDQHRNSDTSPGRWAELLSGAPWAYKRIRAMELFVQSQIYADLTGEPVEDPIPTDELNERTTQILGVS
ncbi:MAG: hypothetical protein AAF602_22075 [Myxococcota bacterium]